jgi:hypothetical protein
MQRLSKPFWFTVVAGTLVASLLSYALVWHFTTQMHDMVALCTPREDRCGAEAMGRAFHTFCLMALAGNTLAFWSANRIGRCFIKPAVTDAVR